MCFILCVSLAGCASGEDAILRDIRAANDSTAAAVAKAEDLDGVKEAMAQRDKQKKEIGARIGKLPREQRESLLNKVELDPSHEELDKALAKFQERLKQGSHPTVLMETSMGNIKIELYEKLAPVTVKNFLGYVDDKFYDGTTFHRVIPDFMIQGGGFEPGALAANREKKNTREPIVNEAYNGLPNSRGAIAMARTGDPHSATAQFFINVKDNPFLNRAQAQDGYGYTVFGHVVEGLDVVDKIRHVKTRNVGGHEAVPIQDVLITTVRRVDKK
jgi:peptidyl-prolyl cis-trans isomerase B (cyclophilin B)